MASLEERIQRLEDIEAIKLLKARYCDACDGGWSAERPGHDWDQLQHIFTEDGVWDGTPMGPRAEGHAQLEEMYTGLKVITFASHNVTNPQITVDGDNATGKWHLQAMLSLPTPAGNIATWCIIFYDDIYVRTPSGWKAKEMKLSYATFTDFEKGWAKERIVDLSAYNETLHAGAAA